MHTPNHPNPQPPSAPPLLLVLVCVRPRRMHALHAAPVEPLQLRAAQDNVVRALEAKGPDHADTGAC